MKGDHFLVVGKLLHRHYGEKDKIFRAVVYDGVRLALLAVVAVTGENSLLLAVMYRFSTAGDEVHYLGGVLVSVKTD